MKSSILTKLFFMMNYTEFFGKSEFVNSLAEEFVWSSQIENSWISQMFRSELPDVQNKLANNFGKNAFWEQ